MPIIPRVTIPYLSSFSGAVSLRRILPIGRPANLRWLSPQSPRDRWLDATDTLRTAHRCRRCPTAKIGLRRATSRVETRFDAGRVARRPGDHWHLAVPLIARRTSRSRSGPEGCVQEQLAPSGIGVARLSQHASFAANRLY